MCSLNHFSNHISIPTHILRRFVDAVWYLSIQNLHHHEDALLCQYAIPAYTAVILIWKGKEIGGAVILLGYQPLIMNHISSITSPCTQCIQVYFQHFCLINPQSLEIYPLLSIPCIGINCTVAYLSTSLMEPVFCISGESNPSCCSARPVPYPLGYWTR